MLFVEQSRLLAHPNPNPHHPHVIQCTGDTKMSPCDRAKGDTELPKSIEQQYTRNSSKQYVAFPSLSILISYFCSRISSLSLSVRLFVSPSLRLPDTLSRPPCLYPVVRLFRSFHSLARSLAFSASFLVSVLIPLTPRSPSRHPFSACRYCCFNCCCCCCCFLLGAAAESYVPPFLPRLLPPPSPPPHSPPPLTAPSSAPQSTVHR